MSSEVEARKFLKSVRIRQEALGQYSLEKPPHNVSACVDISYALVAFPDQIYQVLDTVKISGYTGVSLGCGHLKGLCAKSGSEAISTLKTKIEEKGLLVSAFHGGFDYSPEGLEQDLKLALVFDPTDSTPINYEVSILNFGQLATDIKSGKDLASVRQGQVDAVGIQSVEESVDLVARRIFAARQITGSNRKVLFEVPSPPFTPFGRIEDRWKIMGTLIKVLGDSTDWGITVDIGHVLGSQAQLKGTTKSVGETLGRLTLDLVNTFPDRLHSVHVVSSLTTNASGFTNSFAVATNVSSDVISAIDYHGAPDSLSYLLLLNEIRKIVEQAGNNVTEVAEPGPFRSDLAGFGLVEPDELLKTYLEDIAIQAKLTGINGN